MKKYIYKFTAAIFSAFALLAITSSCSDEKGAQLDLDGGVKITSFKANGIDGIIDDVAQIIKIYAPWSYDLTAMTTEISISDGARITPTTTTAINLRATQKYTILNGNLYNTYVASAEYSKIKSFAIGKYKGLINHTTGKIIVKYPKGEPLTALAPVYTTTPNATVDIANGTPLDFTDPVDYTISYMGESFTYEVTVVPTEFKKVAFVGTSQSASSIANLDEKTAYNWLLENIPNVTYVSFSGISEGNVDLSEFAVVWWHLDGNTSDLPISARGTTVMNKFKEYYQAGGSFFFSSWAVQYVANLGIALDGKIVNNMWTNADGAVEEVNSNRGLLFTGNESHPAFQYLDLVPGTTDKVYLLSAGTKNLGHNAIWNFDWGDYANNISGWQTDSGAKTLASFVDQTMTNRSVMFEYPSVGTSGKTICIGAEGFDWYNENDSPENTYATNIHVLTSNVIGYLSE